jgi:hypothetical protein
MGSNKTTQSSTSSPWAPAQPALQTGLTDAQNLYKAGVGGQVDTTSHVVPFANQSMTAMNSGQNMAMNNINGNGLSGQYQNIINNGGYNDAQRGALSGMQATANSSFDPMNDAGFKSVYDQTVRSTTDAVNGAASGMGRFGGGAHQGLLGRSIADSTGNLMNNAFNQFNSRRDNAQQNVFNAGQQGMSNIGSAYGGMQAPLDTLGKIGSSYEDLASRQMDDRTRIFDAYQNNPWSQLGRLNAVASGAGSMGGTSSGTSRAPSNVFGQLAGGALGLSGLFGG